MTKKTYDPRQDQAPPTAAPEPGPTFADKVRELLAANAMDPALITRQALEALRDSAGKPASEFSAEAVSLAAAFLFAYTMHDPYSAPVIIKEVLEQPGGGKIYKVTASDGVVAKDEVLA